MSFSRLVLYHSFVYFCCFELFPDLHLPCWLRVIWEIMLMWVINSKNNNVGKISILCLSPTPPRRFAFALPPPLRRSQSQAINDFLYTAYCTGWGTIYITDELYDSDKNPWDTPPSFWKALVDSASYYSPKSCEHRWWWWLLLWRWFRGRS